MFFLFFEQSERGNGVMENAMGLGEGVGVRRRRDGTGGGKWVRLVD